MTSKNESDASKELQEGLNKPSVKIPYFESDFWRIKRDDKKNDETRVDSFLVNFFLGVLSKKYLI